MTMLESKVRFWAKRAPEVFEGVSEYRGYAYVKVTQAALENAAGALMPQSPVDVVLAETVETYANPAAAIRAMKMFGGMAA